MNAKRVAAAEGVILAAMQTRRTAAGIAVALESACLLQSPESAAEARQLRDDVTGACLARYEEEQENARLRLAWKSARERAQAYGEGILRHVEERDSYAKWLEQEQGVTQQLRVQVDELLKERQSTNEALDDAVKALRVQRDRIAELEAAAAQVARFCAARAKYVDNINNCSPSNDRDYWRWNGHAEARRQLSQLLGLPVAWPAEDTAAPVPTEDVSPQVAKLRGIPAGQRAAADPDAPGPWGDPIAYGPTGVRCGCGKDALEALAPHTVLGGTDAY
ncbi:hypothetical protein ACFTWD_09275 [Streptomyces sp. NPDC056943]|uniref:hypothetical protein n=1 Tax=Streptomyces sp. NPDC056943 TaxID=3345971 RepID=UPI003628DF18